MTIQTILQGRSTDIYSCTADMSVSQAVEILAEKRIGALPVLDGDAIVGIFSERDVLHCIRKYGVAAMDHVVRDVMTSDVIFVERTTRSKAKRRRCAIIFNRPRS